MTIPALQARPGEFPGVAEQDVLTVWKSVSLIIYGFHWGLTKPALHGANNLDRRTQLSAQGETRYIASQSIEL